MTSSFLSSITFGEKPQETEDTIESLNKVIIDQQKDIDFLKLRMKVIQSKMQQSNEGSVEMGADEPPPHY